MYVIGIETSCDETGIAIYHPRAGVLANVLHSQVDLHATYGGVVPELASRDHIIRTVPLVRQALAAAGLQPADINGVAYTAGPGLVGALLVGAAIARSLAYAWDIPAVAVNHMEAHLLAPLLEDPAPDFPFLALLVSGGHTQLVRVAAPGSYAVIGETLDDAAGEAFDKTAKLLGLGYPGGAAISMLAESGRPGRFEFPRPMTNRPGLDFSFSGLKTHVANTVWDHECDEQTRADIARAFVDAVVETMVIKCRRAIRETGFIRLIAAGGVSANRQLRAGLQTMAAEEGAKVFFPRPEYCTDNGAMIAYAGYRLLAAGLKQSLDFAAYPRWSIERQQEWKA